MLPAAFYDLHCRSSITKETVKKVNGKGSSLQTSTLCQQKWLQGLEPLRLIQLLEGREWIRAVSKQLFDSVIPAQLASIPSTRCPNSGRQAKNCISDLRECWNRAVGRHATHHLEYVDPLAVLWLAQGQYARRRRSSPEAPECCADCALHAASLIEGLRRYVWDELPYFFGIRERETDATYGYEQYL